MAEYETKPGNGIAWKNEGYEKGGRFPYCKGRIKTPDGKEWDIALWVPKNENIKGFNVTTKEPYNKPSETKEEPNELDEILADDLPF